MSASAHALVFERHGDPQQVLSLQPANLRDVNAASIRVELVAAPINPSDINTIQGKYPLCPPLPGTPGHEGVMRVVEVGGEVAGLAPGDLVVPLESALGTWRQQGVYLASAWHKVPPELPIAAAATLCINPVTAVEMLAMGGLRPGDTVVQNGATSAVGQHVIQLAHARGLHTVNVIRDRPDWDDTVQLLKGMGADVVTTATQLKQDLAASGLAPPVLGLNCVGGDAAAAVAKTLREGGLMVTYGAMSMQPLSLPTSLLIFKDITFKGYWLSGRAARAAGPDARRAALSEAAQLFLDGTLRPPRLATYPLHRYEEALAAAQSGFRQHKVAFTP